MTIKDLEARQGNVNLTLEISDKGDIREFEKFGKKGRVCNATAKDATGTIQLTLWNEDIDKVKVGDTIKIENGWVGEWQGELQLSTGKFGKLEVLESKGGSKDPTSADEIVESDALAGSKSDSGEHILTDDEKVEEEDLDGLDEEPVLEEEIGDDEENSAGKQ
jgi:ssDNA-binding replication factor A large subunit